MKIEELRSEKSRGRARVAATVRWEDCDRPTQEVYFETEEAFAEDLSCNPHAFLVGCIIPAMHYGEERVFMDAEVCPELREGLKTVMGWLRHWYYEPDHPLVRIETKTRSTIPTSRIPERAGLFLSGGIDSLATLRTNRLNFPPEHPWSIKDALVVYGLELDEPERFEYVVDLVSDIAQGTGLTLIPVYTNLYLNYRSEDTKTGFKFWWYKFMGASLAAVAHTFAQRLSVVSIAADYDIPGQRPHGSHPLLDPNYGSSDLRIRHDGITLSRFDKTKLVAEWDIIGLQHLRVCNQFRNYQPDKLNCGQCEKCVRTMLALLILGVLDQTPAFPGNDISKELIRSAVKVGFSTVPFYEELITPLAEKGRHDLARAIEHKIAQYHKEQKILNWKIRMRQFDQQYLNDSMVRFKRLFSPRKKTKPVAAPAVAGAKRG